MGRTLVGALCCLALMVAQAQAEPSLNGYTGLLLAPTADSLTRGEYNVGANTTEVESFDEMGYLVNFGVARDIEAGLFWWDPEDGPSETLVNLKYTFSRGSARKPALAVGVADVMDEIDTSVYVVASHGFGRGRQTPRGWWDRPVNLHLGIGGGAFDDFFFGADTRLGDVVDVMAEYVNDEFNVGARAHLCRELSVQVGFLNVEDVALAVTYSHPFGGARTLRPIVQEGKQP